MTRIFKSVFLVFLCLIFVLAFFVLLTLLGPAPGAGATFGACNSSFPNNTTIIALQNYPGDASDMQLGGPIVQLTPTEARSNKFDVVYSQDPLAADFTDCKWVGYQNPYTWAVTPTREDIICPQDSFMSGMQWTGDDRNDRRIYCCKTNLKGVAGTWEARYDYNVAADCSRDAVGNYVEGGLMVGLKNDYTYAPSYNNEGAAVCRKFGAFPKDLRVTVSCGDLGDSYLGRVACSQGIIKNHGCDLPGNVIFFSSLGLGAIYYTNVQDANGNVIGAGVSLDNVLDGQSWRTGGMCSAAISASQVNDSAGTGQTAGCNISSLSEEEYYVTFCARAEAEHADHRGNNCATVLVTANKPDLVVENVSCSGCTKEGEHYFAALGANVTLRAAIKNQGRAASTEIAQSKRAVTFSIDTSNTPVTPVVQFALPALGPGVSASADPSGAAFQHTFAFPTNFSSNKWVDYKVCADPSGSLGGEGWSDYDGDVLESGGTNYDRDKDSSNCAVFRVSASLPDLVTTTTLAGPKFVSVGSTKNLEVYVENIGASQSSAAKVKIYKTSGPDSQGQVCTRDVPVLGKAGSGAAVSETFSCAYTFSSKGVFKFEARVDEEDAVGEINESNNNSKTISVTADYPNLTVQEMTCFPGSPTSPGLAGAAITDERFFCTAKVKNIGLGPVSTDLAKGIVFYSGNYFAGTYGSGCYSAGTTWYCYINGMGREACDSFTVAQIAGTTDYLVSCPPHFQEQLCQQLGGNYQCPAVSERTTPIGPHCSFTLQSDSVPPNGAGEQEVVCDFSATPLFMKQAMVCVDPAEPGGIGRIDENGQDDDISNCKSQGLTFQIPDIKPQDFVCKYSTDGANWSNCLPGLTGSGIDWRIPDGADLKFASKAKNTGNAAMPAALVRGMVYYFGPWGAAAELCNFNLGALGVGGTSDYIPDGANMSEWCLVRNMNHSDHAGLHTLKACVDPKGIGAFGAVFEMDDSDSDNCFEKSVSLGGPDLEIDSFEPPQYVPLGVSFEFYAAIKNNEISFDSGQILAEDKGLVYYIKRGAGAWQEVSSCRTTVNEISANQPWTPTQSQWCNYTINDRDFYTVKACVNNAGFQHETNFDNNCSGEKTIRATFPDLTTYDMKCLPELAHQNETVACAVKIRNQASESLSTPVGVRFYYSREALDEEMTPFPDELASVVVGEAWQTVANTVSFADVGPAFFKFKVDPDLLIQEEREDNNEATDEIEVLTGAEFQPDLTVQEGSVKCGYSYVGATANNFTIQAVERIVCKARVSNIGYAEVPDYFYTSLYTDDDYQDLRVVNTGDLILELRPTIEVRFPAGFSFSIDDLINDSLQAQIQVCADRSNLDAGPGDTTGLITEFKEDNNCAVGPIITVVKQYLPDFTPVEGSDFDCGANTKPAGESFTCSMNVVNKGNAPGNPNVEFYYFPDGQGNSETRQIICEPLTELGVGTSRSVSCQFNQGNFPDINNSGIYTLRACVDGYAEDPPDEYNEENNCSTFVEITIEKQDPITVTLSAVPEAVGGNLSLYVGDTLSITLEAQDDQGVEWVKMQENGLWDQTPNYCGPALTVDTPCVCNNDNLCTLSREFSGLDGGAYEFTGYASGYKLGGVSGDRKYSNTITVVVSPKCVDEDGLNYATKNHIYYLGAMKGTDYCSNDGAILYEYFCTEADEAGVEEYVGCEHGCEDGACKPPPDAPEPVCGNGVIEQGEECDDHNTKDGDGCSSVCQEEPLPGEAWCIDPDEQNPSFTRRTTRDSIGASETDYCKDEDNVYEYYCTEEDIVSPSPNEIPCAFGCANGACYSEQQPILVTFKVIDSGLNGGAQGAAVGSAKIEIYNAPTGQLINTRLTGTQSGSVSFYLLPDIFYVVKVSHSDYINCELEGCDISPSDGDGIIIPSAQNNSFTIEMTKIPTITANYMLCKGENNLVTVKTQQSLTLQDVAGDCASTPQIKGFYVYSPASNGWVITNKIDGGKAGFIPWGLGEGEAGGYDCSDTCSFSKTGTAVQMRNLNFTKGINLFTVPSTVTQITVGDIAAGCPVAEDGSGNRISKFSRSVTDYLAGSNLEVDDLYLRMNNPAEKFDSWKAYWIDVEDHCTIPLPD